MVHLKEIIDQIVVMGVKVLVLYSGHYPSAQIDMIKDIAGEYNNKGAISIIPVTEIDCLREGDHAGISETSLMLYLDRNLVDMTRIGQLNYQDHGWSEERSPELASTAKGESDIQKIIDYLGEKINSLLGE
jgi:creatinine amidohydrolase/Fe(II)-dependent formamide hydrolase-like protein